MKTKTVTLEVANDGTLTIPVDLVRALRLSPRQAITVEAQEDTLVLMPSHRVTTQPSLPQVAKADTFTFGSSHRLVVSAINRLNLREAEQLPHRKERLDRIGYLLRTALAGVEWSEIEGGRRDRCF